MQKARSIGSILTCALLGWSAPLAAEITVGEDALQACFAQAERLNRLACYDALLGRPGFEDDNAATSEGGGQGSASTPEPIRYVQSYLRSPTVTSEGISIRLIDRVSGQDSPTDEGGLLAMLTPPFDGAAFEELRLSTDLYLGMSSLQDVGEEGALLLTCENNITRMWVQWPEPVGSGTNELRFWFGAARFDEGPGEVIGVRLRRDGYIVEPPRGLESIRLLGRMAAQNRVQIAVSAEDNTTRTMFFDTEALRQALPFLARHCAWAQRRF